MSNTTRTTVPAEVTLKNLTVNGQVCVIFEGRNVGGPLMSRLKTAYLVVVGRENRLYMAHTTITGCLITGGQEYGSAIQVGKSGPSLYERLKAFILRRPLRPQPSRSLEGQSDMSRETER